MRVTATSVVLSLLLAGTVHPAIGGALIADHHAADAFDHIPASYFQSVRDHYRIFYGRTSHGSQISAGLAMLAAEEPVLWAYVTMTDEYAGDLGSYGNLSWVPATRIHLTDHPECNVVMWSWCGGVSDNTPEGIDAYLQAMNQLESEFPGVLFVYMTGHLDGSGPNGLLYQNNNRIRAWCEAHDKILFDFADIESRNPDGVYFPDESDACAWCSDWCGSHACATCAECAHSHCFNCYRKGRAFWWMMARARGWQPGASADVLWSESWEDNWTLRWHVDGGTWQVGVPTSGPDDAFAGRNCAATILDGPYPEPANSRLIRDATFVVPAADQSPRLRFWHWFSFDCGDYGAVQLRVGSGSWANVSTTYAGTGGGVWTRPSIDLSAYADSTVQIAFFFHSEDYAELCGSPDVDAGWYIDEVELVTDMPAFKDLEDFEGGLEDWASERGTWEVGAPSSGPGGAHSGKNCAATVLAGSYSDGVDTRLVSPDWIRATSPDASVGFWHWYSFNCGDYGEVQVQDSLGSWTRMIGSDRLTESSGAWAFSRCSLTPYIGQRVRVGFFFHSEDYAELCGSPDVAAGWYIDEVQFDSVTSTLASLLGARAGPGGVELRWYVVDPTRLATLFRRQQGKDADWTTLGHLRSDGTGIVSYEDRDVVPGGRYGYRLGIFENGVECFFGEVWVDVPTAPALFLEGLRPNPNNGELIVSFSLSTAQPVTIQLIDVSGRVVISRSIPEPEPGSHLLNLGHSTTVAPGVYFVRLMQGPRPITRRACIIR